MEQFTPLYIRDTTKSQASFKHAILKYYNDLTEKIYDLDDPRTFKSVCVNCEVSHIPATGELVKNTTLHDLRD